ncbi:MAG: DUF2703 domain-containing protein [Coriobacteriales bacterium]
MSKKKDSKKNQKSSCCCGSDKSSQAYSCEDDRYRGKLQKVDIDFLYLDLSCCDRCQGADKRVEEAVARCRDVLRACGYNLVLNSVLVDSATKAKRYRFESSPTVRVNGVDICPSVEENDCDCCSDMSDAAVSCRIFPYNGTYYEVPPTDMLVRGIMEVVLQNRRPADPPMPYALPENLKKFYEGVEKKAKKGSCCCGESDKAESSCCCGESGKKHKGKKSKKTKSSSSCCC